MNTYKSSYTIQEIHPDKLAYLNAMNPTFSFSGKELLFDNGETYPILSSKYHKWTPCWFARKIDKGYICASWNGFILCKNGIVINNYYLNGR